MRERERERKREFSCWTYAYVHCIAQEQECQKLGYLSEGASEC